MYINIWYLHSTMRSLEDNDGEHDSTSNCNVVSTYYKVDGNIQL